MVPETIGAGSVTTGARSGASRPPPRLAQAARVEKAVATKRPLSNLDIMTSAALKAAEKIALRMKQEMAA